MEYFVYLTGRWSEDDGYIIIKEELIDDLSTILNGYGYEISIKVPNDDKLFIEKDNITDFNLKEHFMGYDRDDLTDKAYEALCGVARSYNIYLNYRLIGEVKK